MKSILFFPHIEKRTGKKTKGAKNQKKKKDAEKLPGKISVHFEIRYYVNGRGVLVGGVEPKTTETTLFYDYATIKKKGIPVKEIIEAIAKKEREAYETFYKKIFTVMCI